MLFQRQTPRFQKHDNLVFWHKHTLCTCWRESALSLARAVCRGSPAARMCRTPGWRDLVDASFCIFVIYICYVPDTWAEILWVVGFSFFCFCHLGTDPVPPSINQYQPILFLLGDYRLLHSLPRVLFVTLVEKWTTSLHSSRGVDPVTSCQVACKENEICFE